MSADGHNGAPDSLEPDALLKAIEQQRRADQAPRADEERIPYLGFRLGDEVYGLPLRRLREVARLTRVTRVPGASAEVAGLVNLRGEIICALDARTLLKVRPSAPPETRFLLVLSGFNDPLGLVVDTIADVAAIAPEQIESPPATWAPDRAQFFEGTARVPDGLMGLLDVDRVVGGSVST